jgi:CBS domain-containing protein
MVFLDAAFPGAEDAVRLLAAIHNTSDRRALRKLMAQARERVAEASDAGLGPRYVTGFLSSVCDGMTVAALEILAPRFRLPATTWCWLGLGSEGRREPTLAADQDNALIFRADSPLEAEEIRLHLLPFAQAVNDLLAECGIPRCDGGVMAGNPAYCLSLDEWASRFLQWLRLPEPDALLNAAIAFDFRALRGDSTLADDLRKRITAPGRDAELCQRMLAQNALQAEPPLGRLRDFAIDEADQDGLDLKKYGTRVFADAARILALAQGFVVQGTAERFSALAAAGVMPTAEAKAAIAAFHALQGLRLEGQVIASRAGEAAGNRVMPDQLDEFSRATLLAALRQGKRVQHRLRTRFRLEGT